MNVICILGGWLLLWEKSKRDCGEGEGGSVKKEGKIFSPHPRASLPLAILTQMLFFFPFFPPIFPPLEAFLPLPSAGRTKPTIGG